MISNNRTAARRLASLALGATVVLGATGCSMISTQATTIQYSPGDGMMVPDTSGPLQVRNVLVVTDDGEQGNLVAAVVNGTDSAETLRIDIGDAGSVGTATIRVPANTVISLGSDETEPLLIEDLGGAMPGTDIPMSFQSGDGETTVVPVPVLDGEQDYLAPLVP